MATRDTNGYGDGDILHFPHALKKRGIGNRVPSPQNKILVLGRNSLENEVGRGLWCAPFYNLMAFYEMGVGGRISEGGPFAFFLLPEGERLQQAHKHLLGTDEKRPFMVASWMYSN